MRVALRFAVVVACGLILTGFAIADGADDKKAAAGTEVLRDGFETQQPVWEREESDAVIRLIEHDRSQRAAHGGRLSEHFHFEAGPGSQFFVSYATPKIPISEDSTIVLYVRSDRPGVRIHAKIVLPADVDPDTLTPSYVLVPGTVFDQVDRWQRLELLELMPAIERQARVSASIDAAAGEARRRLPRAGGGQSDGRARRVGGVPRRPRNRAGTEIGAGSRFQTG